MTPEQMNQFQQAAKNFFTQFQKALDAIGNRIDQTTGAIVTLTKEIAELRAEVRALTGAKALKGD